VSRRNPEHLQRSAKSVQWMAFLWSLQICVGYIWRGWSSCITKSTVCK